MKKVLAMLLAVAMLFTFAACTGDKNGNLPAEGKYPMTLTDGSGNEVTITEEPQKIVSLAPNCTEILYAIGAGDKVAAVSTWCTYPEEAALMEKVGDTYSVNLERIVELEADVVFVAGSFAVDSLAALNSAGIAVYSVDGATADALYLEIEKVGLITNRYSEAKELVSSLKERLSALQAKLKGVESKKVFIDYGGLYTSSKADFVGNCFELIGAENIAGDYENSSPQLSAETVIEKNPQVYIAMSSEEYFVKPDGFDEIDAFKNKNVYYIDYSDARADTITRMGPRFVEGLEELVKIIYPEVEL